MDDEKVRGVIIPDFSDFSSINTYKNQALNLVFVCCDNYNGGAAGNRTRVHQTVQIAYYKLILLGICFERSLR